MDDRIVKIYTVKDYNDFMGIETRHSLVNVVEGSSVTTPMRHSRKNFGIYAIFLKGLKCTDSLKYGRKVYDFQEDTLVFIAPGQVLGIPDTGETFQLKGWCLYFSPELLLGTSLSRHMSNYTFFSYAANEALHLSKQERQTIIDCLMKINDEIDGAADKHSHSIIAAAIELLLSYCVRFYDRQFITRKKESKDVLASFEELLNSYFVTEKPQMYGTPTVAYCAEQLSLSVNYFGDLIKKETGRSAQECILFKTMEVAKELLVDPYKSVSDVAYALGYQYPQYFSKAFKRTVGCSPNEFRTQGATT